MGRTWRAYYPERIAGPRVEVRIEAEEAHYVRRVLRLRQGESVSLFDGRGREWSGELVSCAENDVRVRVVEELRDRVEPSLRIVLYQGICRPERMEWVIQKATEIGVMAIEPLVTVRAEQVRLSEKRLGRWRRVALEACRQCGRRSIPAVRPRQALSAPDDPGTLALLLDPGGNARPLVQACPEDQPGEVWLAVGPEAGFNEDEIAAWVDAGWRRASLGPRTLRTETAGLVAAAILLHRWDDLAV